MHGKPITDFFISYTGVDTAWAEWIGYVLEEAGFKVIIQAWDFRPGRNFVVEMQEAATKAERTLMVLSPDYLKSQFATPEWAAAFGQDPMGREMRLVPVMVRTCNPTGLLTNIVQIRIVGLEEDAARSVLLKGIDRKRAKPAEPPSFPGAATPVQHKNFPGPAPSARPPVQTGRPTSGLIPRLNRPPTDIDKRRFARHGFDTIKAVFEANLKIVSQQEDRIDADFQLTTNTDFRAELFLDGNSQSVCRIWMGGMHSDNNICYSEGRYGPNNSCNEIISLDDTEELRFRALMAMGVFRYEKDFDLNNLTSDDAAEYLWRRFVYPLERQ